MKFKIFIVSILFTVLSVSISKADLASIPPEKKLEIAQQFLENVKTFVKLYPDEFDTIKIFEFILATRPIVEGTLDDKLKEDLKLFVEFTNKSNQFVKYQDEIEKHIDEGLSHKKAIAEVKKEEGKNEEKKEVVKKEEKKEEKINKSNIKNKNDLSKYLIENGLVYINNDGSTAEFIFFQNGKGTHENRIKKTGITWKVENKNIFRWQDTEFLKRGIRFASVTLDFDSDFANMVLSDGAKYKFKIKIEAKKEVVKKEEKKEEVKDEGILIFDCVRLRAGRPTDYIKYEIDTSSKTFRQIFKDSNKDEPAIYKNISEGGTIDSEFVPPYGVIYKYTGYTNYTYGFDYGPGNEFIDNEISNIKSTPSIKCTREK
jgi:hypothetical protein